MRLCEAHWQALRDAIKLRGLAAFVAESGAAARDRIAGGGFDPLIGAYFRILANSLRVMGPLPFAEASLGNREAAKCPICELGRHHAETCRKEGCTFQPADWIDIAANESFEEAKQLGLVQSA